MTGLWPLTTLCFLSALSLLGAASGIEDAFPEDQVAEFLQSSVNWALKACLLPWESAVVTADAFEARLASFTGGDDDLRRRHNIAGLLLHEGRLYLTNGQPAKSSMDSPFMRVLLDLTYVAAEHPALSVEFFLHLSDSAATKHVNVTTCCPVFGFDRFSDSADIAIPHYYVQPDLFCPRRRRSAARGASSGRLRERTEAAAAAAGAAFESREDRLLGRFAFFCHSLAPQKERWPHCQRTYFSQLGQRLGHVGGTQLDVAPINEGAQHVRSAPAVPLEAFPAARYLLVTDGWASAGSLANALATGSVVLYATGFAQQLPSSWSEHRSGRPTQYFEPALKPWVHFVPLWEDAEDDLVRALQRLQADLPAAAAIAAQGRAFACGLLATRPRRRFWAALLLAYQQRIARYEVGAQLVAARNASAAGLLHVLPRHIACNDLLEGNHCRMSMHAAEPRLEEVGAAVSGNEEEEGIGGIINNDAVVGERERDLLVVRHEDDAPSSSDGGQNLQRRSSYLPYRR